MKCSVLIYCVITLVFWPLTHTYAQFDSLGLKTKWRKGSIVLENNSSRKGIIQFNDKLGMIKFKETPDSEEESFVETSIAAMQFYDDDTKGWRNFALFNVKESETGRVGVMLFEVVMEFKKFALLTRVERVNIATRKREDALGNLRNVRVGYEQFENLCLVDEEGTATLVLAVSEFERNKLSMASKLKPYLNKRALEEYLADDWDAFQAIVKTNELNLKRRDDFIRAFQYYREVEEGRF